MWVRKLVKRVSALRKPCLLASPSFSQMPYARLFLLALRETGAGWKCVSLRCPQASFLSFSCSGLCVTQSGYEPVMMKTTLFFHSSVCLNLAHTHVFLLSWFINKRLRVWFNKKDQKPNTQGILVRLRDTGYEQAELTSAYMEVSFYITRYSHIKAWSYAELRAWLLSHATRYLAAISAALTLQLDLWISQGSGITKRAARDATLNLETTLRCCYGLWGFVPVVLRMTVSLYLH